MVGPFKKAKGSLTHFLVTVNKFNNWVEAKPIMKLNGAMATKFLKEIIFRYGYPYNVITDNGSNFAQGDMADFCREKGIRLSVSLVMHPQSNKQAERANQMVLHGIKPRLQVPLE
jgi:transposase InsO family protein